jgi:hypothetical protein
MRMVAADFAIFSTGPLQYDERAANIADASAP